MTTARDIAGAAASRRAERVEAGGRGPVEDVLAVEAPLHVQINGEPYTTTMRTPGADELLIRGLLFTEGIVTTSAAPMEFAAVEDPDSKIAACVDVRVDAGLLQGEFAGRRAQMSVAACGLCGTREPRDIELFGPPIAVNASAPVSAADLHAMMARMRSGQGLFDATGGCHAAAAFDAHGERLALHEDIGRHNAVDKVIGELLARNALSGAAVLTVSGRMSYEIVFKAYRAGIPVLSAVSAASSMAVDTCAQFGLTLVGFCRDDRMTVYTHPERIA